MDHQGPNLLKDGGWQPWSDGFRREGNQFVCDNGQDCGRTRAVVQRSALTRQGPSRSSPRPGARPRGSAGRATPIIRSISTWSTTTAANSGRKSASFKTGTHDWQQVRLVIFPDRPIRLLSFHLMLRDHAGKASFRDPELRTIEKPPGGALFDGVPVVPRGEAREGFQVRDVAAGSDFVRIDRQALGLTLETTRTRQDGASFFDVNLRDATGKDRAVTLLFTIPVAPAEPAGSTTRGVVSRSRPAASTSAPRRSMPARTAGCRPIRWRPWLRRPPSRDRAWALTWPIPAFYRIGYNAGTGELWVAYDIGLTPEKTRGPAPVLPVRFRPGVGLPRGASPSITASSRRPSAAGSPSRGCGCRSPGSACCRAGRISASGSRRGTTRRPGTTRTG